MKELNKKIAKVSEAKCRVCGCTDMDCSNCIEIDGEPCHWVKNDLCSRCCVFVCAICGYEHKKNELAMECCSGEGE